MLARALWWVLLVGGASLYIVALPASYREILRLERGQFAEPTDLEQALQVAGWSATAYAVTMLALLVTYTLVAVASSAIIVRHCRNDLAATLIACVLLAHGWGWPMVMDAYAGRSTLYDAAAGGLTLLGTVGFFCLAFVFPDGRFVPPWTRWVALVFGVDLLLSSTGLALEGWVPAGVGGAVSAGISVVFLGAVVLAVVHRYRRSRPDQRRQLRAVGLALLLVTVLFIGGGLLQGVLPDSGAAILWAEVLVVAALSVGFAVLPLAIAAAVLRSGLWGTPKVLRRALVLAAGGAVLLLGYVTVVAVATAWLGRVGGPIGTSAGAVVVALSVERVRQGVRRWAQRVTLGDRGDAGAAVARLSQRLGAALSPEGTLEAILSSVREAVRSPGAEVVGLVSARSGSWQGAEWSCVLTHQGAEVGLLRVAHRTGSDDFDEIDRRLLTSMTGHVAIAVHAVAQQTAAVRLARDLSDSRQRLVRVGEEERRRLRRDLHDGLGPVLAGQVLRLETARDVADPDQARELLDRAVAEAVEAVAEIRRVVDGLRPPVLDDAGLEQALRVQAARMGENVIVRQSSTALPDLPAAVSAAAFHIASEAMVNAARHATGATCWAGLDVVEGSLVVTVEDDGPGVSAPPRPGRRGLGMVTMRERAEELGGTLDVEQPSTGGTRVAATLPLTEPMR